MSSPSSHQPTKESAQRPLPMGLVAVIATLGGLLFGYDTGVISGALPLLVRPVAEGGLALSNAAEGVVTSVLPLGAAAGALLGGPLSDKAGRRRMLGWLAVLFFVAAIGCSLSPNMELLVLFRILLGIAVGGASTTVPVYLAEVSTTRRRGSLVAVDQVMIVTGQLLAYTFNAIIALSTDDVGAWRWMLSLASIPAIALWIGMRIMPESPRWFVRHGDMGQARASLGRLRAATDDIDGELESIQTTLNAEESAGRSSWSDLRQPWVLKLVVTGMGLSIIQQITGVNAIMYYAPRILESTGISVDASLTATIGNGVMSVLAALAGLMLVHRLPRKHLLAAGQIIIIITLASIGVISTLTHGSGATWIVLALMMIFLVGQQGAVSPVTWVMLSEIFPLRIRGLGVGLSVLVQWLANALISGTFPVLLGSVGLGPVFGVFAVLNVIAATLAARFLPETSRDSLEEIELRMRAKA